MCIYFYPATLLKLLIISTSFLVDSLGLCKQTIISSPNSDKLVSSLPILIPSIYFSSLIATANVSSTMLKKRGDSGHSCFTPDLTRKTQKLSPLHMIHCDGFKYILLTILRKGPFIYIFSSLSSIIPNLFYYGKTNYFSITSQKFNL